MATHLASSAVRTALATGLIWSTVVYWLAGGARVLAGTGVTPREAGYTTYFNVPYAERGKEELLLDAYIPNGSGPFPAVVVIHGGAWRMGNKAQLALHAARLARAGFAAFCINYRLAPAHKWPAQIHDCKAAVVWVRRHAAQYKVRPDWIAAYGYSAGAHLACMLGVTDPKDGFEDPGSKGDSSVQAVCAGGTPCDFTIIPPRARWLTFWLGKTRGEDPELYRRASPISFVDPSDPPTLLYHGAADQLVPLPPVRRYVQLLRSQGIEAELVVIPDAGHILAPFVPTAIDSVVSFLRKHAGQKVEARVEKGDRVPGSHQGDKRPEREDSGRTDR